MPVPKRELTVSAINGFSCNKFIRQFPSSLTRDCTDSTDVIVGVIVKGHIEGFNSYPSSGLTSLSYWYRNHSSSSFQIEILEFLGKVKAFRSLKSQTELVLFAAHVKRLLNLQN